MSNVSNQWCAQKLNDFLKSSFKIENESKIHLSQNQKASLDHFLRKALEF